MLIFPWTGLPFGFLRLILSLFALVLFFLSLGLYQKEQKISDFIRGIKQSSLQQDDQEVSNKEAPQEVVRTERKKLSDVLS